MVLTGGPGVGKTTTLRALLDVLDARGVQYALAAPTGRAAKRMTEATGRPASTLHRLLEFQPHTNDFGYNEHRPLPQRFVIVDEVSMLDILLAYRLVRAVHPEAHLLLVGDADQLPSVGPGSVLADILKSEAVPQMHLTELFRQAAESAIIVTAHGVNAGEMPALKSAPNGDFFFLPADDPQAAQRLIVDLVARRLPAKYGFDPVRDIQVLSPMYRGPAGVVALNEALQARLNPSPAGPVAFGDHTLRTGDKVMQVRNNYDKGAGGVFNGDLGRIVEVTDERQVVVAFSDDAGAAARHLRAARAGRADAGLRVQHPSGAGQRVSLRRAAVGRAALPAAAAQPALYGDHPRPQTLRDRRRSARAAPRRRERCAGLAQHWPGRAAARATAGRARYVGSYPLRSRSPYTNARFLFPALHSNCGLRHASNLSKSCSTWHIGYGRQ